jgi:hypothetical protein
MHPLQKYLSINGVFSALSGAALVIGASRWSSFFGVDGDYIFTLIGALLLGFSAFVLVVAQRRYKNKFYTGIITLLDLLWVLGSAILIAFNLFDISSGGRTVIALVALWIGFLAVMQMKYRKQLKNE